MAGEGPFLSAAFFCDRVLQEADGTLSAIRIVDRVFQVAAGIAPPEGMPPTTVNLTLLIALKSGAARGRHDLKIQAENPSGIRSPLAQTFSVLLEGEDRGANAIINLVFTAPEEGLYWFDVLLDGERLTRVPLRLVYLRQELGSPGTPPQPGT